MDASDLVYLVFLALWVGGQIAAVAKKQRERQRERQQQRPAPAGREPQRARPPAPAPMPARPAAPAPHPGQSMLAGFTDLDAEIAAALDDLSDLDERVRAQVTFLVDNDYRPKADRLRPELRNESSPDLGRAVQEAQWLLSHYRGVLATARVHSGLRRQGQIASAREIADQLTLGLDPNRNAETNRPPPVAIVWDLSDPSMKRLRESALADATLFVPRTVVQDPSHWSLIAPEIERYITVGAPSFYREIYDGLELGVEEAQIGNEPEALTRVLYASWIGRIVADAVGASFFGPSYLLALAHLYAQPGAPARATSIALNQDGSVHPEPPPHVRVHVTARWLTRMGFSSEATAILKDWDEGHGSPQVLGFWGSMTSLPAAPVLDAASGLTDNLFQLPLDALGGRRLSSVDGVSGWEHHARAASSAKKAFLAGQRAQGPARALVAAAIEAALEAPENNAVLHRLLHESVVGAPIVPRAIAAAHLPTRAAVPSKRERPVRARGLGPLTGRDVAEAMILGELLLEPRSR